MSHKPVCLVYLNVKLSSQTGKGVVEELEVDASIYPSSASAEDYVRTLDGDQAPPTLSPLAVRIDEGAISVDTLYQGKNNLFAFSFIIKIHNAMLNETTQ